jgi:hypothetical protein
MEMKFDITIRGENVSLFLFSLFLESLKQFD